MQMRTGFNNVALPTLFIVVKNIIVTHNSASTIYIFTIAKKIIPDPAERVPAKK